MLSQDYEREKREMTSRGYKGSPMRASPSAALPNQSLDLPYSVSRTRERQDAMDPYESESRFPPQGSYSEMYPPEKYRDKYMDNYPDSRLPAGYSMSSTSGYPPGSAYPPSQASGYPSVSGYPSAPGYPAGSGFPPQGSGYPPTSGFPPSSGYMAPSYTSTSGLPGNRGEPNYTYADMPGEYPPSGYPYQQSSAYSGGSQANPRAPGGYPFVSSPQDPALRGVPMDDRNYELYSQQQMASSQASRGAYAVPSRGTPTQYDPPQPRDGFTRAEPPRDERRVRR